MFKTKINNRQTVFYIELRNPDSPSLMEIRRSEVKPCRNPSKIKNVLFAFFLFFREK